MTLSGASARAAWVSLLVLAACSEAPPSEPSPVAAMPVSSHDPSEAPSLSDESDWGPLAVFNMQGLGMDFLPPLTGRLEIGDCVRIGDVGLVWDSANTRWDETREMIVFRQPFTRTVVELKTGDEVAVGGGGLAIAPQWISAPHSSCQDALWAVQMVDALNGIDLHASP